MKKITCATLCILFGLLLFSCKNEPIFYGIEQEINLDKPVVLGNVYAMTEAGGRLYAANGKLYSKNSADIRGWSEDIKPEGFVIRTASDSSFLYSHTSDKVLYSSVLSTELVWTKIDDSVVELFDNNALGSGNKRAFYTKADAVYEISGGNTGTAVSSGGASFASVTSEYINGQTYFSSSILFTSDRSSYLYRISENGIEYSTDTISWTPVSLTIESPMSLEFFQNGTYTALLAGTKTGVVQIAVTNSIPASSTSVLPGANADSCFGTSHVPSIFAYPFAQGNIYVSSLKTDSSNSTKFWGYYPTRDNWNLE